MLYAIAEDGTKITPGYSGQRARCPGCDNVVVARCGRIMADHWSHLSGTDCDPWTEPLSLWHLKWQTYLASQGAEIEARIEKDGKVHRADAKLKNGIVVELQHSHISVQEIEEREAFYEKMIWVFDIRKAYAKNRFDLRQGYNHYTFRWKHPRKSVAYANCQVRLDLGEGKIFQLKRIYEGSPCGGSGQLKEIPELAFECYDLD